MKVLNDALTAGSTRTDTTGTVDLTEWASVYPKGSVIMTVSGGNATMVLEVGATSTNPDVTTTATATTVKYTWDDGPWPYLAAKWSANSATMTVEAVLRDR